MKNRKCGHMYCTQTEMGMKKKKKRWATYSLQKCWDDEEINQKISEKNQLKVPIGRQPGG